MFMGDYANLPGIIPFLSSIKTFKEMHNLTADRNAEIKITDIKDCKEQRRYDN